MPDVSQIKIPSVTTPYNLKDGRVEFDYSQSTGEVVEESELMHDFTEYLKQRSLKISYDGVDTISLSK